MDLPSVLAERREAIVKRWRDLALDVYPQDSTRFLGQQKDRFSNPVGHITGESLTALFQAVLDGSPPEKTREALDGVVRVRAVQDLSASRALEFVFQLKRAIAEELGEAASEPAVAESLAAVHSGIDRLALQAFDHFMHCREQIYDLRAREVRRRTASLLERLERQTPEE